MHGHCLEVRRVLWRPKGLESKKEYFRQIAWGHFQQRREEAVQSMQESWYQTAQCLHTPDS